MTIPLQRLRELLPFSQSSARGESVPVASVVPLPRVVAHIDEVLLPRIIHQKNLLQRFCQLEAACQEAEPALVELERRISAAPLPLPSATQAAVLQADNLIKRLAHCYSHIAHTIIERQGNEPAPLFFRATRRAMAMLTRRQLLAHRACTLPSASSWLQLHALYL